MNKIIKADRGIYYVEKDGKTILCKARGLFRNENIKPLVGDNVEISINSDGTGYIEKVFERKNQLLRPYLANIDQVVIIMSLVYPKINLNLLDKYIVMLEKSNVEIKIVFNKMDLLKNNKLNYIIDIYKNIGYEVFLNSNKNEDIERDLRELFRNRITAVAGPSGVGKSTTLNKLFKGLELNTGEISQKNKRGKHTTRHAEMSKIDNNSYVVDTPGFSSLVLTFLEDRAEIKDYFIEFKEYESKCKYYNCLHLNEPLCGVKDAVENNEVSEDRYKNYRLIVEEFDSIRRF